MVFPNPLPLPRVFRFHGTNFSQSAWVIMADRNTQVTICRIEHERFPPPCLEIAITGKGSRMLCTQFFAHLATNQGCGKLTLSSATSQHARMEDIGFLFLFLFLSYQHLTSIYLTSVLPVSYQYLWQWKYAFHVLHRTYRFPPKSQM